MNMEMLFVFFFRDNVCYLDEQTIVYPAGSTLVIYNTATREQKFIPGSHGAEGFTAMAVSPNRRYIAAAEKSPAGASVAIYDLHTLKKRKVRCPLASSLFICPSRLC